MDEALRYLRAQRDVPLIAFVGAPSRSWWADVDVLCAVMEILREARIYQPVRSGAYGFDYWLKEAASRLGLVEVDAGAAKQDGRYLRDPGMLDGACMLVAFPEEDTTDRHGKPVKKDKLHPYKTADQQVVELADRFGIPVLCVRRSGQTEWFGQ